MTLTSYSVLIDFKSMTRFVINDILMRQREWVEMRRIGSIAKNRNKRVKIGNEMCVHLNEFSSDVGGHDMDQSYLQKRVIKRKQKCLINKTCLCCSKDKVIIIFTCGDARLDARGKASTKICCSGNFIKCK